MQYKKNLDPHGKSLLLRSCLLNHRSSLSLTSNAQLHFSCSVYFLTSSMQADFIIMNSTPKPSFVRTSTTISFPLGGSKYLQEIVQPFFPPTHSPLFSSPEPDHNSSRPLSPTPESIASPKPTPTGAESAVAKHPRQLSPSDVLQPRGATFSSTSTHEIFLWGNLCPGSPFPPPTTTSPPL